MSTDAATPVIGLTEPDNSFAAIARRKLEALKAGDTGFLPVIVALAAIVVFFYSKNSTYLSAGNFTNLITQMAGLTCLAIGVVFVLLLGEIDLSIGFISGLAGVVVASLQVPDGSWEIKGVFAMLIAILVTVLVGMLQGSIVAFVGVPSFAVTLAGLLIWQGVVQRTIGESTGVIVIQDTTINNMANYFFPHSTGLWIAIGASALFAVATLVGVFSRRRHGINSDNLAIVLIKVVFVAFVAIGAVVWANGERGLPLAGVIVIVMLIFWTWVAERTTFGRHVYAVGGNAEAARRAGINVKKIRVFVFMISGAMAGLGGVILAARLNSVALDAGGGTLLLDAIASAVVGGTSLFGGRGRVLGALMGALVLSTVENGIDLVGYASNVKFMVTGIILLAAVTLDAFSRKRLARSGR